MSENRVDPGADDAPPLDDAERGSGEHDADRGDTSDAGAGRLVRRLLVFQFKLLLDGLRDVLLSPVSIGAAVLGIVRGGPEPDVYFRRLLRFGRRTDRFIDLFEAHEAEEAPSDGEMADANAYIDTVERIIREEVSEGRGVAGVEARIRSLGRRGQDIRESTGAPPDSTAQ